MKVWLGAMTGSKRKTPPYGIRIRTILSFGRCSVVDKSII
jgi:hypothetical protein